MALASTLSALREMILDGLALPAERAERVQFFAQRYPHLESNEISDLAAIDPKRLAIYTTSIFVGQRNLLARHFSCAFPLLKLAWRQCMGEELSGLDLVRRIHRTFPWRGSATLDLTRSFIQFLANEIPAILTHYPYLVELAQYEELVLKVRRSPGEVSDSSPDLSPIAELTVDRLLELPLAVAQTTHFANLRYPVHLITEERIAAGLECKADLTFLVLARDRRHQVQCTTLPAALWRMLESRISGADLTVGDLAHAFLLGELEERSEEESFSAFLSVLSELIDLQIITVGEPFVSSRLSAAG